MYQYILCGLKVESDLAFPELTPWPGAREHPFEIEFRLGPVEQLWGEDEKGVQFEADGPDKITFHISGAGRILIERGKRVVFDAFSAVDEDRIRLQLIGTIQSMLWYQRGYLPLHASALLVDDRAIAIGACSHSGKSVLAAALTKRGCPLIVDDMMVVDWSQEVPIVLPGYQKLRLWKDACEQLGLMRDTIAKAHLIRDKFVVETVGSPPQTPVPLTDVLILTDRRGGSLSVHPLGPVQGLQHLLAATHMLDAARALGRHEQIFAGLNSIIGNARIWRATAPQGLQYARATADSILTLVRTDQQLRALQECRARPGREHIADTKKDSEPKH